MPAKGWGLQTGAKSKTYSVSIRTNEHIAQETDNDYLPVYYGMDFSGVITLQKITLRLAEIVDETKQHYQRAFHDLRNPVGNVQALTNHVKGKRNNQ
ncbi:hypothetical protein [Mucilaginibacter sabulilitoris]|uniref:hypothetical protein n=1 Tax=Mucilaginibacter sabulilitoris TaxID=1173583 RepID=UPI003898DFAD